MRAVVQRVAWARVRVEGSLIGEIGQGLAVLVGAMEGDSQADVEFIARKLCTMRIFEDDNGKMNRSVIDVGCDILLVSQFTLAADTTSGTRPSFSKALAPIAAKGLLEVLASLVSAQGIEVANGRFGAKMLVETANDGPVTIILDSQAKQRK